MSKIAITPHASGDGIFTIAAPNSDTDRTITLPDASGIISIGNSITSIVDNGHATAITIDSSENVGIGEVAPANLLHVKASDTGITPHASAQIVLEREGTNYLQFLTAETGTSGILFGDGSDIDVAQIKYDHNTAAMSFVIEASERMRIDSSGNLIKTGGGLISSNGTGDTLVISGSNAANTGGNITLEGNTASDVSQIKFKNGSTEVMRIAGGRVIIPDGVTLGTAAGVYTAANTLDDYEEGTWTPVIAGGATGGSYSIQTGHYVKVGKVVHIEMDFSGSGWTGDGNLLKFGGLPFAGGAASGLYGGGFINFQQSFFTTAQTAEIVFHIGANNNIQLYNRTGNIIAGNSVTNVNARLIISARYFTDA